MAHRLARAEGRTIASVVERALDAYSQRRGTESAEELHLRLSRLDEFEPDQGGPDLAELVEENRRPHADLDIG